MSCVFSCPPWGDIDTEGYTVEYYYDKNERLVFVFSYKKEKGKVKEYRAYYSSTNGKYYRTINSEKKTTDYKTGKDCFEWNNRETYYAKIYSKGLYYLHLAYV